MSKAAFDLLGWLPVLPGPCGMYRYEDLANGRLAKYFDLVNMSAEECGLVCRTFAIFDGQSRMAQNDACPRHA